MSAVPTRVQGELSMLLEKRRAVADRRTELRALLTSSLERASLDGRGEMNAREMAIADDLKTTEGDLRQIGARVRRAEEEVERAGNLQFGASRRDRPMGSAAATAPLGFGAEEIRRLQSAAQRGEPCRVTRDFSSDSALLPAQLYSQIVGQVHEGRLLSRLPGVAMETGSIEFIRHISTSGEPAATGEGQPKPELVMNVDALTATAVKLACHTAVSYEVMSDHTAFADYVNVELTRQVVDLENLLLLHGGDAAVVGSTGTTEAAGPTGMIGFLSTPSILKHDAAADTGEDETALDSIEKAISEMRTGPALATPTLLVLSPDTWSAMRRTKDGQQRYMTQADPTVGEASSVWGVEVLTTTQMPAGKGLPLDTAKCGFVGVREPLSLRLGFSGDDFTRNLIRTVCEERLVLAVTRPPAVSLVSGLPR